MLNLASAFKLFKFAYLNTIDHSLTASFDKIVDFLSDHCFVLPSLYGAISFNDLIVSEHIDFMYEAIEIGGKAILLFF